MWDADGPHPFTPRYQTSVHEPIPVTLGSTRDHGPASPRGVVSVSSIALLPSLRTLGAGVWGPESEMLLMGKDVDVAPAREIQRGASRQEIETGLGQGPTPLPIQNRVQFVAQPVQVKHVRSSIA